MRRALGSWQVLLADEPTAAAQMARDEDLARSARPTLRLFHWMAPAVSLGFRQPPPAWAEPSALSARGIELVERPTGGGAAIHGSDLSCSVVIPAEAQLSLRHAMALACESLAHAAGALGAPVQWYTELESAGSTIEYCLTQDSPYAIMSGGRKLCGLAIRRYPMSWLIQGSMLVRDLPQVFEGAMPPDVLAAFQSRAISLEEAAGMPIADSQLIAEIVRAWRATWGIPCFWSKSPQPLEPVHAV